MELYLAKITKTRVSKNKNSIEIDAKTNKEYLLEILEECEKSCEHISDLDLGSLKKYYGFFDFSDCTLIPTKFDIRKVVESVENDLELGKLNHLRPEFAANDLSLVDPKYWNLSKKLSSNTAPFLTLLGGPMGAGKTTELIRRVKYYLGIGKNVVCMKSVYDIRYNVAGEVCIRTHDNKKIAAIEIGEIFDQIGYALSADVIVIDELQFYISIKNVVTNLMKINKIILFTGLISSHDCDPLLNSTLLLPYFNELTILGSKCEKCGDKAYYISTKDDRFYSAKTRSSGMSEWEICCFKHHYKGLSRLEN